MLIRVEDGRARAFYELEAAKEGWSVRELERQVASLLFERLAKSRDKDEVLALAKQGQTVSAPKDVVKDPFVLEFLELQERSAWLERDLEQAIIDRLESFLLELGKGFCFVARQKRLTLVYLPTKEELREELEREREDAERTLRRAAAQAGDGEG